MRRKEAGFIVAQAAIFIAILALVALPQLSPSQPVDQPTRSSFQVIRESVSITDHSQMTPCSVFAVFCNPQGFDFSTNGVNVDLIRYQGSYYYAYNETLQVDQQPPVTSTVWFTNSTVYCVTPQWESYGACPAGL